MLLEYALLGTDKPTFVNERIESCLERQDPATSIVHPEANLTYPQWLATAGEETELQLGGLRAGPANLTLRKGPPAPLPLSRSSIDAPTGYCARMQALQGVAAR